MLLMRKTCLVIAMAFALPFGVCAQDTDAPSGFEPFAEQLVKMRLLRPEQTSQPKSVARAANRFRASIGSAAQGAPTESEKALLANREEAERQRDTLKNWLLDYHNQRKLVATGALNEEVGNATLDGLRQAVIDYRTAVSSAALGPLSEDEKTAVTAAEQEIDSFARFEQQLNKDANSQVILPRGLVEAEPDKNGDPAWTTYRSRSELTSVYQFRTPLRAHTAVSLAAQLLARRTGLEFDRLDLLGQQFAIEGYTKPRWGHEGGREYIAFGAREHNGFVKGYGLVANLIPPSGVTVPKIRVTNEARRRRNAPMNAVALTDAEANWRAAIKVIRNLLASKQNEIDSLDPISRSTCAGITKGDGGATTSVKVFYATNREQLANEPLTGGAIDLSALYSSNIDTGMHLGCIEVDVRAKGRAAPIGSVSPGMSRAVQQIPLNQDVQAKSFKPLTKIDFAEGKRFSLRGDEVSGKERALLFVHGYNNGFKDAIEHVARIAAASEYYGQVYLFSWPSSARSLNLNYAAEMDFAEQAEVNLTSFIKAIMSSGDLLGLDIVAHSMGSQIVLRTLDSIRPLFDRRLSDNDKVRFGQIIFAAPDVSSLVFKQKVVPFSYFADRITVYASSNDGALDFSGWLRGSGDRAGYVGEGGPIEVDGIQVIDVTGAARPRYLVTRYCGPYHAGFVHDRTVLEDIALILKQGASGKFSQQRSSPVLRASNVSFISVTEERYRAPSAGKFWKLAGAPAEPPPPTPWYDTLLKDACIQ